MYTFTHPHVGEHLTCEGGAFHILTSQGSRRPQKNVWEVGHGVGRTENSSSLERHERVLANFFRAKANVHHHLGSFLDRQWKGEWEMGLLLPPLLPDQGERERNGSDQIDPLLSRRPLPTTNPDPVTP